MAAGKQINELKSITTKGMNPGQLADPGEYKSTISPTIDSLVNRVANRQEFTYDPETDAAFKAYEKKYTRLGNNAREDTLADVATNTGGLASSYAVSAAAQAQNDYNQQLTDLIPQLMQAAYERYDADRNYDLGAISSLQSVDDSRFNQFDANRSYALGAWQAKNQAWMDALGYNLDLANGIEGRRQFNLGYNLDKSSLAETKRSNKANEKLNRDQFNWQKAQAQKKTSSSGGSSGGGKSSGKSGKKSSGKSGKGSSGGKSGKSSGGSSGAKTTKTTATTQPTKEAKKPKKTTASKTVYGANALLPNGMKPASTSKKKKKTDKPKITKKGTGGKVYANKFQLSSFRR